MKVLKKLMMGLTLAAVSVVSVVGCSSKEVTEIAPVVDGSEENVVSETMKITHEYGTVEVPKNPKSIVVTDFGILDTVHALGVTSVVGIPQDTTSIPEYLEVYKSDEYTNVGGVKEINFEVLYELAPEIIFISGRLASQYDELSKIAPVVYINIDTENYMESLEEEMTVLGELFGKEEEVKTYLAEIWEQVDKTKALATSTNANGLITMVNKGEISVYGEVSRFGIIHNTLGVIPADTNIDDSTHGQTVTFEYLLEVNPEYLFVIDRNAIGTADGVANATAKDTLNNSIVNKMSVAQEDKIIYLDPVAWYMTSGGATATKIMITEIFNALN
ncbi:MAG: siderophore ABC transporter substrate-binding protein [Cellulosilyticaceae bacterium]